MRRYDRDPSPADRDPSPADSDFFFLRRKLGMEEDFLGVVGVDMIKRNGSREVVLLWFLHLVF
jgi:hypothetical protein